MSSDAVGRGCMITGERESRRREERIYGHSGRSARREIEERGKEDLD